MEMSNVFWSVIKINGIIVGLQENDESPKCMIKRRKYNGNEFCFCIVLNFKRILNVPELVEAETHEKHHITCK